MDWLAQNWVWVLVFVVFIGMHMFGHGGHGGCCGGDDQRPAGGEPPNEEQPNGCMWPDYCPQARPIV